MCELSISQHSLPSSHLHLFSKEVNIPVPTQGTKAQIQYQSRGILSISVAVCSKVSFLGSPEQLELMLALRGTRAVLFHISAVKCCAQASEFIGCHESWQGNMNTTWTSWDIMSYHRGNCWNMLKLRAEPTRCETCFGPAWVGFGAIKAALSLIQSSISLLRCFICFTEVLHAMFQSQRHSCSPSRQEMSMPALIGYSELNMLVCRLIWIVWFILFCLISGW